MAASAEFEVDVVIVAGLVGLLVGSFLNVVVYRVPRGISVNHPRSFCPVCRTQIRSADNIPVISWLMLGGKCRTCRTKIPARYPIVEGTTGTFFAMTALATGPSWGLVGECALVATLIATAVSEMEGEPASTTVAVIGTAAGALALVPALIVMHGEKQSLVPLILLTAVASVGIWGGQITARRGTRPSRGTRPARGIATSPEDTDNARGQPLVQRDPRLLGPGSIGLVAQLATSVITSLVIRH